MWSRVVHKLPNDGAGLLNIGHHVGAGLFVRHAHLGFQAQTRQGGAQVMRDASQHQAAIMLNLCQLPHHAVEALVHRTYFGGGGVFVQLHLIQFTCIDLGGRLF